MKEPLKITYRHGDHEVSVQVDDSDGHIDNVMSLFFECLKGAGFQQESIDKYLDSK
jgi:hypothetical protein